MCFVKQRLGGTGLCDKTSIRQLIKRTTSQQPTSNILGKMDKSLVTLDKIIDKSKQWTLEGDCTLLQWMNQISKNLEERVIKTNTALNEMSTKLDRTSVALSNVTNNLAALQYSQFVENRVHDDDETLTGLSDVPDVGKDETDNKDANHNIYSFLKKNLEMMNSCHEAYSISYDDSDEDEPATNVVYRSKNPYEARSLPHIYGSKLWKEKWHIGLCDSDNDFSGDEESEQFSESSSTADDSYESTAPTLSEWDSTAWGLNTNNLPDRKGTRAPSNDGESSLQGEDSSQSEVSTPRAQRNQPIIQPLPEQRYYQHVQRNTESNFHDIFTDSEQQTVPKVIVPPPAQKIINRPSLIADEPPPDPDPVESDNNRRIGATKPLNLFDDDEFSSFMGQIVKTASNRSARGANASQESAKKPVVPNLFDESVQTATKTNTRVSSLPKEQPKKAAVPNLFDDCEGIEESFPEEPPQKAAVASLFDDAEDIFTPKIRGSYVEKENLSPTTDEDEICFPPALPKLVSKTKTKNLFEDDDDDDDFEKIFAAKPNKKSTLTKNLFDDVLEDLAGVTESANDENKGKEAAVKQVPLLRKGLFDDDEDDLHPEKDLYANKPPKKIDLFEDVFSERPKDVPTLESDLFGDHKTNAKGDVMFSKVDPIKKVLSMKSNLISDAEQVMAKPVSVPGPMVSKAGNILKTDLFTDVFQDEPPEDIFATQSEEKRTKIADIFADNFADDFEEFVPKRATSNEVDREANFAQGPSVTVETNNQKESELAPALSSEKTKINVADLFADKPTEIFEEVVSKLDTEKFKDDLSQNSEAVSEVTSSTKPPEIDRKPSVANSKPAAASSSKKNADIFADDFADDFEEFIPKLETKKAHETVAEKVGPSFDDTPQNRDISSLEEKAVTAGEKPLITKVKPTIAEAKPTSAKLKSTTATPFPGIVHTDPTIGMEAQQEVIPAVESKLKPAEADGTEKLIKYNGSSTQREDTGEKKTLPATTDETSYESTPETGNQTEVPSYTSLFHDEPPPDDNASSAPSFEEPPADDDATLVATPPAAAAYNSINLFADVPPDDDFSIVAPMKTKRIHSIFYDDFNETIEASREMRIPSSYIFNDEPPPDDEESHSSNVLPKEEPKVVKERPKVSKLRKMDLQINVGALLPTAKAPSFKKLTTSVTVLPEDDFKQHEIPTVKPAEKRDLPENILPNLNRDRARVQVKRRPSTRRGRQESYRKSMIDEDVILVADEGSDDGDQPRRVETFKRPKSLFEDFGAFDVKKTNLSEIFANEQAFQTKTTVEPKGIPETENDVQNTQSSASKIASLFEDSDTDPGSFFETIPSKKEKPQPSQPEVSSVAKIKDSLFDSDDLDENPFGTPKKINETPAQLSDTTQVPFKPLPSASLVDTADSPEENLPAEAQPTRRITKPTLKSLEEPSKPGPKPTSLFGESDEGSDDLFKDPQTAKKPTPQKTIEKKPKPKPVSQPVKAAASLFSSDEESGSGDDIFGMSKKATSKKGELAKAKPSSSLFADLSDDDDDDLFGATKKKPSGAGKPISRPAAKAAALAQHKTPISNNPLSDLLGP